MIQGFSPYKFYAPNKKVSDRNLIKSTTTTKYILISMITPLIDYSLASSGRQIYAHADIYTPGRTKIVAHKSGRQLFGMDVREMWTSS